jgi:hypothetical protein
MKLFTMLSILAALGFAGCASQSPLQDIAANIDQLQNSQFSQQWQTWAEDALKHADTLNLAPVELEQAKACSNAILKVIPQKNAMLERIKQHLLARDAQLQESFNPIIAAQDLKFGQDPVALLKADEKEIIGWGEYLLHSCSNLFPTDKAMDLAKKVFGGM